jgi:hypothetical protein
MNEPSSLFDLAMYRTNEYLEKYNYKKSKFGIKKYIAKCDYEHKENKIIFELNLYPNEDSFDNPKKMCNEFTVHLKKCINHDLDNFFRHYGHQSTERPDNLFNKIKKIMEIKVIIREKVNASYYPVDMYSISSVTNKEILFSDK